MRRGLKHPTCSRAFDGPFRVEAAASLSKARQQFLSRDRSRQWFVDAVRRGLDKHAYHLWAYVIMPEHVHLLVWPTQDDYNISAFLQSIKTSVVRQAIPFVRKEAPSFLPKMLDKQPNGDEHYRFWQRGGGYDRNITETTTAWHEINYFHANPVRRDLCERPEDWYWSSAAGYLDLRTGPLKIDSETLPRTPEG